MKHVRRRPAPSYFPFFIAAALGAPASAAVTRTWAPPPLTTTASWSNASDWSPAGIPLNGDTVSINVGGSSTQTILYDYTGSALTLASLVMNHNNPIAGINASEVLSISTNTLSSTSEHVADASNRARAEISQSGGQNSTTDLFLGVQANNLGLYTLSSNAQLSATNFTVGGTGSGLFSNLGGTSSFNSFIVASGDNSTGTVTLSGGNTTAAAAIIGARGAAILNVSGGTFSCPAISVGQTSDPSTSGAINLSAGELLCSGTCNIGELGAAVVNQSGGAFFSQNLNLGGGNGAFNLSGGSLTVSGTLSIATNSSAVFNQTGGSCSAARLAIGENNPGTCTLSGSASLHADSLIVGDHTFGTFIQTGGFNSGTLVLGNFPNTSGNYFLAGPDAVLVAASETIGGVGSGTFTQSAGTHIVTSQLVLGSSAGFNGQGTFHLDGGTLQVAGAEIIGNQVTGSFFQTGGIHTLFGAADLIIGGDASLGGIGLYSLSGGVLHAANLYVAGLFDNGAGTFTVTNSGSLALAGALAVNSRGTVSLGGSQTLFDLPAIHLNGGLLSIVGTAKTLRTSSLSFAGTTSNWSGHLDTTSNSLIVQATPATKAATLAFLRNVMILPVAGGGAPNAIFSSSVMADPATSLALADNADLAFTSFRSTPGLDANTFIITQAHNGDANLDGKVDAFDLNLLAAHWQQQTNALWSAGDFNNDGKVDAFDLNILAANWQFGTALEAALSAYPQFNGTPVPEPATVAIVGLGVIGLLARRKRRP